MSRLLVTDTSCLIALDRVDLLDVLPRLHEEVVAPTAVVAEFGWRPAWLREEVVRDRAAVRRLLVGGLDAGEAEALVLARTLPGALLLIDEARGRTRAVALGLPIIGTAGLLAVAKRAGLIPAVKPVLDALINDHAFRLAHRHYEAVLEAAGEG